MSSSTRAKLISGQWRAGRPEGIPPNALPMVATPSKCHQACAAALGPDERLVQIHFDPAGGAHALVLAPGEIPGRPALTDIVLPQNLARARWGLLLNAWEASRQGRFAAWDSRDARTELANAAQPELRPEAAHAAASAAWSMFVSADSPASTLLEFMLGLAPRCTVILPAELAQLPWLARAVSGSTHGQGDFTPGRLVVEASVSAWLRARTPPDPPEHLAPPPQVTYGAAPIAVRFEGAHELSIPFGELEANAVAIRLGSAPRVAGGMVEILQALKAGGPAHLCVHGCFAPFDPFRSYLSLDGRTNTLPAWLLQCIRVRGDISLSACEAMLVGPGQDRAAWSGPVGLGPLLRARGARTVVGPLGKSHPLASWLFYELWYEARQTLPAVQALAHAQASLREMLYTDVLERIKHADQQWHVPLQDLLNQLTPGLAAPPFAHPAHWAQFTLLGDAPVLPRPPAADRHTAPTSWLKRLLGQWSTWRVRSLEHMNPEQSD